MRLDSKVSSYFWVSVEQLLLEHAAAVISITRRLDSKVSSYFKTTRRGRLGLQRTEQRFDDRPLSRFSSASSCATWPQFTRHRGSRWRNEYELLSRIDGASSCVGRSRPKSELAEHSAALARRSPVSTNSASRCSYFATGVPGTIWIVAAAPAVTATSSVPVSVVVASTATESAI